VYLLDNFYGAIALALLFVLRPYLGRYVALGVVTTIWAPSLFRAFRDQLTATVGFFG
jgi:hypothetical protein